MRLTQEYVEGLKLGDEVKLSSGATVEVGLKRIEIPDDKRPGLYLLIQPSVAKSWAVRYRFDGKARKYTIGPFPRFDLKSARKLALKAITDAESGNCPAEKKKASRRAAEAPVMTIDVLAEKFIEQYAKKRTKERSWRELERIMKREVLAKWNGRRLVDIKRRDIAALLGDIASNRPVLANRVHAHLHKMFAWAMKNEYLEINPVTGVDTEPEKSRDRTLTDDELKAVLNAATRLGGETEAYLRLLILTLARRNEVARMSWAEIDFKAATWTLPASRAKNKREHTLPLPEAAVAILEGLKEARGSREPFVFSSPIRTGNGLLKAKRLIDSLIAEETGEPLTGWRFHDLRRTGISTMARLEIAMHVAEKIANHVSGSFKGIVITYNRYDYRKEMRAALEKYAAFLDRVERGDNVVSFEARRQSS
jgi:integrase